MMAPKYPPLLCSDQVWNIHRGRTVDNCSNVIEAAYVYLPKTLFEEAKTTVGGEFCIPTTRKERVILA